MSWLKLSPILLLIGLVILAAPHIGGIVPLPAPHDDALSAAYAADRVTQIAVLRELAAQPFDGTTDEGRRLAGEFYNANRFKNRASDFSIWTDQVAESIAANSEGELAAKLEAGR